MIRPITCLCVISAAASGLYLYQTKHTTHMLDRQIEQTMQAANAVREHSQLLRAEWANLNDTVRLADLAGRHLNLRPVTPAQFVNASELDRRLPATRSFAQPDATPGPTPDSTPDQAPPPIAQAAPEPHPLTVAQTARASSQTLPAPAAAPQIRAAAAPAPLLATAKPQIYRTAAVEPGDAADHEARAREPASRTAAPRETPVPMPVIKPVFTQAMATGAMATGAMANGAVASALPRPAARVAYEPARAHPFETGPQVTSALGNARTTLAPPVPVPVAMSGPPAR